MGSMIQVTAALVTGASGGLGYEFSLLAAADGNNLILIARNKERLEQIAGQLQSRHAVAADIILRDLSLPGAAQGVFDEVQRRRLAVGILINNAGFGISGPLADQDPAALDEMMHTNMTALTLLTRLFLPEMIARRSGRILNVASTAAFQPGPLMAAYYASKAYVLSFTEALAEELRGTGVTATALCPGPMRTGFQTRADLRDSRMAKSIFVVRAPEVAKAGYDAMLAGRVVCVPGALNAILASLARLSPPMIAARIARRLNETPSKSAS